jgi:hypothetical protein
MPNLDLATETMMLPMWAAWAAAVLLVALVIIMAALTMTRSGAPAAVAAGRVALLALVVAAVWVFFDRTELHERAAERRALEQRAGELAARALAPGSALACLDAVAGDAVEAACEHALFASPQGVAAAVSYVSERLGLLAAGSALARRDSGYEAALAPVRQALEADRFGFLAHVLSVRDNCTPLNCDMLSLLRDPSRVQANLKDRVFDNYVSRYAAEWPARAKGLPVAEGESNLTTAAMPAAGAPGAPTVATPLSSKYDFPSAASIPPVSIMNPEPGLQPEGGAKSAAPSAASAAPASTPTPPRRPPQAGAARAQQAAAPARPRPAPPQRITPPAPAPAPVPPPPSAAPASSD